MAIAEVYGSTPTRVVVGHGARDRAVAQQVVGHVNEGLLQGLVDQEPSHAGAVDEQVRLQRSPLLGGQAGDVAALVQVNLHDLVDHAVHPAFDGPALQEVGHQVRVEVPRVGHLAGAVGQARCQLAVERLGLRVAGVLHRLPEALFALAQPVVGKRHAVAVRHAAEQMVEVIVARAVGRLPPVHELDGGLERAVHLGHPLPLRNPEEVEEHLLQTRDGRLAHADPGDRRGLDERNVRLLLERPDKVRGGHPARGAAAHDDDILDRVAHDTLLIGFET